MTDFCSIDGRLTPLGEGLPGGVYLYQRLRTVDYRPLHTAAHLSRLRDGAGSLFGRPAELPAGRIADEIGALLHANGYPAGGATVTLSHLCPAKPASCGGGRSLRRLPSRMAHVGTPRNGTVGAAGGRAVRCALCASLRPRRHRPQGRRRAAVRRARRRDLRRTPRRRGVDVGGRSGAAGRHPVGGTTRRRSAASAVRRTLLLRLRGGQLDRLLRRHALSVAHGRTHRRGTGGASRTVGSASAQRRAGSRAGRDDRRFPKNRNTTAARGAILCGKPSYS